MANGGSHLVPAAESEELRAQVERLVHDAGVNFLSLKAIAGQLLPEELKELHEAESEEPFDPDYETGYDALIRIARLAVERGEPGTGRKG